MAKISSLTDAVDGVYEGLSITLAGANNIIGDRKPLFAESKVAVFFCDFLRHASEHSDLLGMASPRTL